MYEEPRRILELLGYRILEMYDSKENSVCCGSCGGLVMTNPELADKIAYQRLLQARRLKVNKIIVNSLDNYDLLKRNSSDMEVLELSEILANSLGIKIKPVEEKKISEEEQLILDIEADKTIKEELKEEYEEESEEDVL